MLDQHRRVPGAVQGLKVARVYAGVSTVVLRPHGERVPGVERIHERIDDDFRQTRVAGTVLEQSRFTTPHVIEGVRGVDLVAVAVGVQLRPDGPGRAVRVDRDLRRSRIGEEELEVFWRAPSRTRNEATGPEAGRRAVVLQPDGVRDTIWSDHDSREVRSAGGDGFD